VCLPQRVTSPNANAGSGIAGKNTELQAQVFGGKANLAKSEFLSSMSHELRTRSTPSRLRQLMEPVHRATAAQITRLHQIIKADGICWN